MPLLFVALHTAEVLGLAFQLIMLSFCQSIFRAL